ncbi:LPXTG cell wall anchor domain-containing protein [Antribacter gilvus]|uniref:LPXTG cell wall anchor domain-containing protein n=1 Tax=Antribacter gilvus TaxID=2304675 RepID=UPI000F7B30D6|nr:LPXTG cell wall anchor domain-containing protein [Antribacter gilvus]
MRKLTVLGAATLLLTGLVAGPAAATVDNGTHYPEYDTCNDLIAAIGTGAVDLPDGSTIGDKIDAGVGDTDSDHSVVTVPAPTGTLISGYCVKAGSAQQPEAGVYLVILDEPVGSVDITYPWASGKDVSHYALVVVQSPGSTPTPTPTPTTSESPSSTPTPTGTESPSSTPTPTDSESPSGTPTPSTTASTSPSGSPSASLSASPSTTVAGVQNGPGGPLAQTGPAGAITLTVLALALVGGGASLLVFRRRQAAAAAAISPTV